MADTTKGRIPFTAQPPQMILGLENEDTLKWDAVNNKLVLNSYFDVPVLLASVEVTSAELLALYSTAKPIVAAPGAGKYLEFCGAVLTYNYRGTAYTINGSTNLTIAPTDKNGTDVSGTRATTGLLDQAAATTFLIKPTSNYLTGAEAEVSNVPLCLKLVGANPTVGNGTLTVNLYFRIHETATIVATV